MAVTEGVKFGAILAACIRHCEDRQPAQIQSSPVRPFDARPKHKPLYDLSRSLTGMNQLQRRALHVQGRLGSSTFWAGLSEGAYLLRSGVSDWKDEHLWKAYIPKPRRSFVSGMISSSQARLADHFWWPHRIPGRAARGAKARISTQ